MPFLRDEGPPIPQASIQKLRESLPVDYGWQVVNETGREVLVVRVPKSKPDYLHDLSEVAFYVGLETIRNTKDVLLIGHEKTARLEPQLLRDHIRSQGREDVTVVDHLRRQLDRQYGHTFVQSPSNHQHGAFAVRIPKETVAQFTPDDVNAIRQLVGNLRPRFMECQYAYVVSNGDHERLGRRTLLELIGESSPPAPIVAAPEPAPAAAAPVAAPAPVAHARSIAFPSLVPGAPAPVAAAPAPAAPVAPAHASAPSWIMAAANTVAAEAAAPAALPAPAIVAAPAPLPIAVSATAEVEEHEEYEIVSKPKAPAPVAAPIQVASRLGLEGAEVVHDEYEIVSKPKAPVVPEPVAAAPEDAGPERKVLREDNEFEVFTSKPKVRHEAPSITPPGMAGFQAALHAGSGPAPQRTKEYEISGRTSVTSDPSIISKMRLPSSAGPAPAASPFAAAAAAPAAPPPMQAVAFPSFLHAPAPQPIAQPVPQPVAQPAPEPVLQAAPALIPPIFHQGSTPIPPRVATPAAPSDSGVAIVARMTPAAPELVLAQRFKESGYEVVEGLRAQGTVFAFAAHKANGRRVLVRRTESFAAEDAATLSQLVAALGADVALVVADHVKPGTRLATWGTRIEVVTPGDVPDLAF